MGLRVQSGASVGTEPLCFPALVTVPSMGYALVQEPFVPPQLVAVRKQVSTRQISSGLCSPPSEAG